jgi:hypothetical protein
MVEEIEGISTHVLSTAETILRKSLADGIDL